MCHPRSPHDFYGIGVANLIFGVTCFLLPIHGLYQDSRGMDRSYSLVKATDGITLVCGILTIITGICGIVLFRRLVEHLNTFFLAQVTLILAIITVVMCPVMVALNIATNDPVGARFGFGSWPSMYYPTENKIRLVTPSSVAEVAVIMGDFSLLQLYINVFSYISNYLVYRYAITTSCAFIGVVALFVNAALIILITRGSKFWCCRIRGEEDGRLNDSNVYCGDLEQNGGATVIQPLPDTLPKAK